MSVFCFSARACPRGVFSCEGDAFTPHTLAIANRMACIYCDECLIVAKDKGYPDLITITQKPDVFRFIVEVLPIDILTDHSSEADHQSAIESININK